MSGALNANKSIQGGFFGFADEVRDIRLGAVHGADDILQGVAASSLMIRPGWRPGWSGLYDFYSGRLLRHGPSLEWDPGCDCLRVTAAMEWADDRKLPNAMIRLDLQPR